MDQSPSPDQTTPQSAPPAAPGAHYQMPPVNPGQTTGIIGLIFAFVGLAPIGLVLSIISTVKSSQATTSKTLGIVGIILNALGIFVLGFFAIVVLSTYSGIQGRAVDSETKTHANMVAKHADAYYAEQGNYPQLISDFSKYESSRLEPTLSVISGRPNTTSEVQYRACGATGAQVAYLSSSSTVPVVLYLGNGSSRSCN